MSMISDSQTARELVEAFAATHSTEDLLIFVAGRDNMLNFSQNLMELYDRDHQAPLVREIDTLCSALGVLAGSFFAELRKMLLALNRYHNEEGDHFAILGLAPSASINEVKKSYRRLSKLHHPDIADTAEDGKRFMEISGAYHAIMAARNKHTFPEEAAWRTGQPEMNSQRRNRDQKRFFFTLVLLVAGLVLISSYIAGIHNKEAILSQLRVPPSLPEEQQNTQIDADDPLIGAVPETRQLSMEIATVPEEAEAASGASVLPTDEAVANSFVPRGKKFEQPAKENVSFQDISPEEHELQVETAVFRDPVETGIAGNEQQFSSPQNNQLPSIYIEEISLAPVVNKTVENEPAVAETAESKPAAAVTNHETVGTLTSTSSVTGGEKEQKEGALPEQIMPSAVKIDKRKPAALPDNSVVTEGLPNSAPVAEKDVANPLSHNDRAWKIASLIDRYTRFYRQGALIPYFSLFMDNATENGQPLSGLAGQYQALFDHTDDISLNIFNINWQENPKEFEAHADFTASYTYDDGKISKYAGSIIFHLVDNEGSLKISALDYKFQK